MLCSAIDVIILKHTIINKNEEVPKLFAVQVAVGLFRLVRGYFFRKRTISETWRYKPRLLVGFVVCMFSLFLNAYFIAMNGFISRENRDMREIITNFYLASREQEYNVLELPPDVLGRYVLRERLKPDKPPGIKH